MQLAYGSHGNIKLDFGYNPADGPYRSWSVSDTYAPSGSPHLLQPGGLLALVGRDSVDLTVLALGQASMNFGGALFRLKEIRRNPFCQRYHDLAGTRQRFPPLRRAGHTPATLAAFCAGCRIPPCELRKLGYDVQISPPPDGTAGA